MNKRRLQALTARQLQKVLDREGRVVLDVENNSMKKVIFKRIHANNAQEKIQIIYPQSYAWNKGTIIKLQDMYFLIINRDAFESDVYYTSTAIKCNVSWKIDGNDCHFVAGDLGSANPSNGTFGETVNGSINLFTADKEFLHDKLKLNDSFFEFGGVYKVVNKFFIDGLAYIYLQRTLLLDEEPSIMRDSFAKTFSLADGSYALNYYVGYVTDSGTTIIPSAKITYTVSDEKIATVNENGVLIFHSAGTVTVTCESDVALENGSSLQTYHLTKTETFTISNSSEEIVDNSITWTVTQDFLETTYINSSHYNTLILEPSKTTDKQITWKIFFDSVEYTDDDLSNYVEIHTDEYMFMFRVINSDLALYFVHVEAVVDGVTVATSGKTKISY